MYPLPFTTQSYLIISSSDMPGQTLHQARGSLEKACSGLLNKAKGTLKSLWTGLKSALTPAAPTTLVALRRSKEVVEMARATCAVVQIGALIANAGLMGLYSKVGGAVRELTIGSGVDIGNARLACHMFLTTHRGVITFVFVAVGVFGCALTGMLHVLDKAISRMA